MDVSYPHRLSLQERKTTLERMVKLQEEVGELAQEVLLASKAPGMNHKQPGKDGVQGECVDVIVVALSIFFAEKGTPDQLEKILHQKCQKWERVQQLK